MMMVKICQILNAFDLLNLVGDAHRHHNHRQQDSHHITAILSGVGGERRRLCYIILSSITVDKLFVKDDASRQRHHQDTADQC